MWNDKTFPRIKNLQFSEISNIKLNRRSSYNLNLLFQAVNLVIKEREKNKILEKIHTHSLTNVKIKQ